MRRNLQQDLEHWYKKRDRKPLILRGARQVGKSTLVKLFADENNLDLMILNLEKLKFSAISNPVFNIQDLIQECEIYTQKKISSKTLIFFDEIQEQTKLIQFLRYFYEERSDLAVIAAGSLLELKLKKEEVNFPVGRVEFLFLGPMSFSEFLLAQNKHSLIESMNGNQKLESTHLLLIEELKSYLYVGGMPKAVNTFINTRSPVEVREVQDDIIYAYKNDFPKYNRRIDVERIERVFIQSAFHIGKKMKYQELDESSTSRDIRRIVELLIDAQILINCPHSNATKYPLMSQIDDRIYKTFFLDVGLLNAILQQSWETITKNFSSDFSKKGEMMEQFIAQHLCFFKGSKKNPELFYWLNDKSSQKGEVDFLIDFENRIYPIEIKASSSGKLKSLFYFSSKTHWEKAVLFSTKPFSVEKINHLIDNKEIRLQLINIPIYQIESLKDILAKNY